MVASAGPNRGSALAREHGEGHASQPLENVIFCSICGFTGFRVRDVVHHLSAHSDTVYRCGIDSCSREYARLASFKQHLTNHHEYFYPDIVGDLPGLDINSIFSYSNTRNIENPPVNDTLASIPSPEPFDQNSPSLTGHDPETFDLDAFVDERTKRFLEILVQNGCHQNITFKALKGISSSLMSFAYEIASQNLFSEDLLYSLLSSVNTSDKFDSCLEKYFQATFPEVINIGSSSSSFVFFPFRVISKTIFR